MATREIRTKPISNYWVTPPSPPPNTLKTLVLICQNGPSKYRDWTSYLKKSVVLKTLGPHTSDQLSASHSYSLSLLLTWHWTDRLPHTDSGSGSDLYHSV